MNREVKTALLSVYNKEGIVEFAREIKDLGYKILASGGTAKVLSEAGIEATDVASLVGGGAILGHRVVTLSREVHAGLLARDNAEDRAELEKLNIPFIDLVCVDLYPLEEEIAKWQNTLTRLDQSRDTLSQREREDMTLAIIEKTDIGGPTMLRSAAKGRRIVICDPEDRFNVVQWLKGGEQDREQFISKLCAKAEFIVAEYCLTSAQYHSKGKYNGIIGREILEAKYGENGWQKPASLFVSKDKDTLALSEFKLLAGTIPSYNNWADVDRLLQTITHIAGGFDVNSPQPPLWKRGGGVPMIALGVKHGNPCGAGVAEEPAEAIQKMLEGDLRAIFGGLVMVNFEIDEQLAEVLLTHKMDNSQRRLLDGIIAPVFSPEAIALLKRKGDKCRFLVNPTLSHLSKNSLDTHSRFRCVRGGFLNQPNYNFILELPPSPSFEKRGGEVLGKLSVEQKSDIILAWAVGSTSNSNTVSIVKDGKLLGNGVGQQDRVSCCELAIKRATDAQHDIKDAVAYSDSFFPFPDGPLTLIRAGIKTIFATAGSVRDEEIKKVCAENKVVFVTLPDPEARGFFGH